MFFLISSERCLPMTTEKRYSVRYSSKVMSLESLGVPRNVSKSPSSHAFIFMLKNVIHETSLAIAREARTHRRQLAWRMFKFCSGDFPHLSFPLRRFVCLPFLFVSPPSSLASCCYCSLMRPQSGQNCGGFVETWKKRVTRSFSTSRFQYFSQHFSTSISRTSRYSTRQCMHALYRCKFSSRTRMHALPDCLCHFLLELYKHCGQIILWIYSELAAARRG